MSRFRFQRSAASPARRPKRPYGIRRAKLMIPALAGECVSESASSGYAIVVEDVPALERNCPACNSTNSRFRQGYDGLARNSLGLTSETIGGRRVEFAESGFDLAACSLRDVASAGQAWGATVVSLKLH